MEQRVEDQGEEHNEEQSEKQGEELGGDLGEELVCQDTQFISTRWADPLLFCTIWVINVKKTIHIYIDFSLA